MRYPEDRSTRNRTITDEVIAMIRRIADVKPAEPTRIENSKFYFTDTYDGTYEGGEGLTTTQIVQNAVTIDQSSSVSTVYGDITPTPDSTTLTFQTANGYKSGSLIVKINGLAQEQGTAEVWVESDPDAGIFTFNTGNAPATGDIVQAIYEEANATGSRVTAQSGGTGATTFGTISGDIDGSNRSFTVDTGAFIDTTCEVEINGQGMTEGSGGDFEILDASTGNIRFVTGSQPTTGDVLTIIAENDTRTALIAQSGGTGDTYGTITGTINGVNKIFTNPGAYEPGSLNVWLNGVQLTQADDYSETNPGSGTFTFVVAPVAGDEILTSRDAVGSGGSCDCDVKIIPITATYTAVAQSQRQLITADATSAAITVTLPLASTMTGKLIQVIKTDSSANAVTIDGNGSETINGATTQVINLQYDAPLMISDGTGWYII